MNILVTGGAGYIGSHTCKALAQNGYTPVTYDNLSEGHREAVKWGPFEEGDISDRSRLDKVIKQHHPQAIIHFAANAYVGESVENPAKYYRNNVSGTLTLLEALRDHEIGYIVFSSSCAVYGIPEEIPIPENHPIAPINPYGRTKMTVENMLQDFNVAYGLQYVSLRYFNAAGADADGETGEAHDPETHLIPIVLDTALARRPSVPVNGNDYDTPDGTCIRDYTHVSDLADAHIKALQYLEQTGQSGIFNLGTGKGHSIWEIIDTVREITGKEIKTDMKGRRQGDPDILVAQAESAEKLLGWKPIQSDIGNIIETAWQWHNRKSRL
jgi:UDP-glucose-4-epimerase GalE